MKRLAIALLLPLSMLLACPAVASLWDSASSEVALRANHAGYIDDETIQHFTQNVLPELISLIENQGYVVQDFSLLSSETLKALFTGLSAELRDVIFGPDATPAERAQAIYQAFGVDALAGLFGFTVTLANGGERAAIDALATFQSPNFTSALLDAYAPDNLALFKIRFDNTSLPFVAYAESADDGQDGHWCLLDANGEYIAHNQALQADGVYAIRYWVKNNGAYDLDSHELVIDDPVALGFKDSGDGDNGGCVLAPRADPGLEWLLLLLAPLGLLLRRRA